MLLCEADCNRGDVWPSIPSVLASFPLACSKKMPYPPRMAVLPLPRGSQANPIRGAGLNRCPFEQPTAETEPTAAAGNAESELGGGTLRTPPVVPQTTRPSSGLPTPETRAPVLGST